MGVGRTKFDYNEENELIHQLTMLQLERSAVLLPKPNSGVPGAPTRWKMSPGMELHVTTLYLDLNGVLLLTVSWSIAPKDDRQFQKSIYIT